MSLILKTAKGEKNQCGAVDNDNLTSVFFVIVVGGGSLFVFFF